MNRAETPTTQHHELSVAGMAPWPVPAVLTMDKVRADPTARCCKECGRTLILLVLRSSTWVSRRTEHVSFRDDRSVVRRVTVEFHVPEEAPVFRGDDSQVYSLVPLSIMRRKTLVNFELRDEDGRAVVLPSLRHNQAITESLLLACADAIQEQAGDRPCASAGSPPEIADFVHQVVSGDQGELTAAYASLANGTAAPAVLGLVKHDLFKTILDRLADNFVLWVMIPAGAPRRRVLTFSCDEPLHLRYREPSFEKGTYKLGANLKFWRPIVWCSALGLTTTRIEFPVPAAENTASFHFEIDAPKGVQITEASLLAGRPEEPKPSLDHVRGGFPTVGLHVIEVPNGSLSRVHVGLQVVTRGWLMTSTLSAWAVFAFLLAFAMHDTVLRQTGDLPTVILVALASGVAAIIAQPDAHGLAAHLLRWARSLAAIAVGLPLVAMTFIVFATVHPNRVPPALWTVVGVGGVIAVILTVVCGASRRRLRQRTVILSPWEQSHKRRDAPQPPEDFEAAEKKYQYKKPAMRVDSAEGWHTEFHWNEDAEERLIATLDKQKSAHRTPYGADGGQAGMTLGRIKPFLPSRRSPAPLRPCGATRGTILQREERAAAGPDDKLGREDDTAVLVLGRPVGLVEQELGRRASELVLGLADRGERDGGVRGELDVVVADDREISGCAHARLAQPAQQAESQHVVGAEHAGGRRGVPE
jgi:hypothetical protein